MSTMLLTICSGKHIGTKECARNFFELLDNYKMLPDKIGLYEPLRESFSLEKVIKMWTFAGGSDPDFRHGMVIGKKKEPSVGFDVSWHIGEKARVNTVNIWFTKRSFKQYRKDIGNIFRDLIDRFDSFYGYITDIRLKSLQHVPGTLETRMHGIFWCNYFGKVYIDFFGAETLANAPWFQTERLDENRIITYTTKDPDDKELINSDKLVNKIKECLGKDSFGDPEKYIDMNSERQIKNVPKLDLSEIRKPISYFIDANN